MGGELLVRFARHKGFGVGIGVEDEIGGWVVAALDGIAEFGELLEFLKVGFGFGQHRDRDAGKAEP